MTRSSTTPGPRSKRPSSTPCTLSALHPRTQNASIPPPPLPQRRPPRTKAKTRERGRWGGGPTAPDAARALRDRARSAQGRYHAARALPPPRAWHHWCTCRTLRAVLTRAFFLPTCACATGAPQWTALLLAGDTPTPTPPAASRKNNGAGAGAGARRGAAKGKKKESARFELAGAVQRLTSPHSTVIPHSHLYYPRLGPRPRLCPQLRTLPLLPLRTKPPF